MAVKRAKGLIVVIAVIAAAVGAYLLIPSETEGPAIIRSPDVAKSVPAVTPAARDGRDTTPSRPVQQSPPIQSVTAGQYLLVIAADSSRPIEDARIHGVRNPQDKVPEEVLGATDASGRWKVPGRYPYLLIVADGYAQSFLRSPDPIVSGSDVEVRLPRNGVIRGHIVDSSGRPVPAVALCATQKHLSFTPEALTEHVLADSGIANAVVSSPDGAFVIEGLRADEEYHLESGAIEYYFSRTPVYRAATPDTAPDTLITLLPVYAWAVVARHMSHNMPRMIGASVSLPEGLMMASDIRRSAPGVSEVSPQQSEWIRKRLASLVTAVDPSDRLLASGAAVRLNGSVGDSVVIAANLPMSTTCGAGLQSVSIPNLRVCRLAAWTGGCASIVDMDDSFAALGYYRVDLRFVKTEGGSAGFVPPCVVVEVDGPQLERKKGGCEWVISSDLSTSEARLRLPRGTYAVVPKYDGPWGRVPFSFSRVNLEVSKDDAVEIRLDKSVALVELEVADGFGLPLSTFGIQSPTLTVVMGLDSGSVFAVPSEKWRCRIRPIGYTVVDEPEQSFDLKLGTINRVRVVLSKFR